VKYELYRITNAAGNDHYAFVVDDDRKAVELEINADGDPFELVWTCEADSHEEAIDKVNSLMEEVDWRI